MRVAVYGQTGLSIGITLAADLAGLGHPVTLCGASEAENDLISRHINSGLRVSVRTVNLISKRTGPVEDVRVEPDVERALSGAKIIFLDTPPNELENRIAAIAPHLQSGQHIHIQTHGYWVSVRAARALKHLDVSGITFSECTAPTHASEVQNGAIIPHVVRKSLPLGVFPAVHTERVASMLGDILPIFDVKQDVLETNLESMNFLVHPAIALTGVSLFETAKMQRRKIRFYQEGNTADASALAEALDDERRALLSSLRYEFRKLSTQINALYGGHGGIVQDAIENSTFYHRLPDLDPDIWRTWMEWDLPYAHVPYVHISESLGHPAPLHRALVDIFGAILGKNYWDLGLTLDNLGISDKSAEEIKAHFRDGMN